MRAATGRQAETIPGLLAEQPPPSSPAVAGEGDREAVEGPFPLETYEREPPETCETCGLDPCACALLDPELEADLSADVEALAAAAIAPEPEPIIEWPIRTRRLTRLPDPHAATAAFTRRRHELLDLHGVKACVDLSHPDWMMAREARDRLGSIHERLRDQPTAEARDAAFLSLLSAGALTFALFDKMTMEPRA